MCADPLCAAPPVPWPHSDTTPYVSRTRPLPAMAFIAEGGVLPRKELKAENECGSGPVRSPSVPAARYCEGCEMSVGCDFILHTSRDYSQCYPQLFPQRFPQSLCNRRGALSPEENPGAGDRSPDLNRFWSATKRRAVLCRWGPSFPLVITNIRGFKLRHVAPTSPDVPHPGGARFT